MAHDHDEESLASRKDEMRYSIMAAQTDEAASEHSPLLRPQHSRTTSKVHVPTLHTTRSILLVVGIVVLLTSLGDQLQESPQTRIFESIICYDYYEKHDPSKIKVPRDHVGPGAIGGVDEMWCKAPRIQDDLAKINGYANFFDGFPYLLMAVPFGWAADKYGRWPFIFMNLMQFAIRSIWTQIVAWNWQVFDLKAVWANAAFALIGGGSPVASNLFFVAIADVTLEEDRAAAFLRIGAANLAANLFMPPIAAWLMIYNPWIPLTAGTGMMLLAAALFFFIPETLNFRHQLSPSPSRPQTPTAETMAAPPDLAQSQQLVSADFAQRRYSGLKSSLSFLVEDWRTPALISTFLGHLLMANITRLLLQYLSNRYDLTFSKATLLVTVRNGVIVLLLFCILPYLSTWIMRAYGLCGQRKDLYLARASQSLIAIGWLLVALSPNVPIVAISLAIASLGYGSPLVVRSLLTSLLPTHHIAIAYSLVSMTDTVGSMLGSPFLAGLFARGLALGGFWIGLPFFFIALLATLFSCVLFVVRVKKAEDSDPDREEEETY